jgi:uroporphyrinogen-III synthase
MARWRLLLTGPVHGLERWRVALERCSAAAELAVLERPLIETLPLQPPTLERRPDWLCVTSQSALPAIDAILGSLEGVRCAVVGARSAAALRAAGLSIEAGPSPNVSALLDDWLPILKAGELVLWPRGSESDAFARTLRNAGALVEAPIVYETRSVEEQGPIPAADAVFFASPSGVTTFTRYEREPSRGPSIALAIGPSTAAALRSLVGSPFESVVELASPTPEALAEAVERLRSPGA